MKIAVASEDGRTVAPHFGQATYYVVFFVEEGRIVGREQRDKPCCDHGADHSHGEAVTGAAQDDEADGRDLHTRMSDVISDCEAALAGGIPRPMQQHLLGAGIQPVMTRATLVEDAAKAYLAAKRESGSR